MARRAKAPEEPFGVAKKLFAVCPEVAERAYCTVPAEGFVTAQVKPGGVPEVVKFTVVWLVRLVPPAWKTLLAPTVSQPELYWQRLTKDPEPARQLPGVAESVTMARVLVAGEAGRVATV
jgi:hypothetical protein